MEIHRLATVASQLITLPDIMARLAVTTISYVAAKERSRTNIDPQLLSTHNNSVPADDMLKSHNVSKQYPAADCNSDEEARSIEEILNALGPITNKF